MNLETDMYSCSQKHACVNESNNYSLLLTLYELLYEYEYTLKVLLHLNDRSIQIQGSQPVTFDNRWIRETWFLLISVIDSL
jgi:hypothetical protein